ncbi:hypothetical protein SK128_023508 [Halocaridina rubra]|uniref:Sulfotransferase domain-containing protein n=1 Tax=Halocaridina rubra TaxID=373956 RepID=A0AAN8X999_HALRR
MDDNIWLLLQITVPRVIGLWKVSLCFTLEFGKEFWKAGTSHIMKMHKDKMLMESGHTMVKLKGRELARLEKNFRGTYNGTFNGLVRVTPGDWLYPGAFKYYANKLYSFDWRKTDVVVTGFLKCGTTWIQEIIWTMRNNPNLDNPDANTPILSRVPIIEYVLNIITSMSVLYWVYQR